MKPFFVLSGLIALSACSPEQKPVDTQAQAVRAKIRHLQGSPTSDTLRLVSTINGVDALLEISPDGAWSIEAKYEKEHGVTTFTCRDKDGDGSVDMAGFSSVQLDKDGHCVGTSGDALENPDRQNMSEYFLQYHWTNEKK